MAPQGTNPGTYGSYVAADRLAFYAVGALAASALGAAVWWAGREHYYSHVPLQYQYRPGTISGFLAKLLDRRAKRRRSRRPIRVYMDGCFDLMHYGHANALRQARALGDQLVVGLIPDSEILRCKGPPVLRESERLALVESIKWVDEVIRNVPYDLTPEFLEHLFSHHKIDYVIHGDDPCLLPDGTDAYAHAKALGRFLVIKRTEGVSTTELVGRMLLCTRDGRRVAGKAAGELSQASSLARDFSVGSLRGRTPEVADAAGHGGVAAAAGLDSVPELDDADADADAGTDAEAGAGADVKANVTDTDAGADAAAAAVAAAAVAAAVAAAADAADVVDAALPPHSVAPELEAAFLRDAGGGPSEGTRGSLEGPEEGGPDGGLPAAASPAPDARAPSPLPGKPATPPSEPRRVTVSRFMPTSRRIVQFSSGRAPPPGARIAYVDGAFDLFHPGHVAALRQARAVSDFLLVGVHSDEDVARRRGAHQPVLDVHERALSVLACRYADEVIIGAPNCVSEDLLTTFNVSQVLRGTVHESTEGIGGGPGAFANGPGTPRAAASGSGSGGTPRAASQSAQGSGGTPRAATPRVASLLSSSTEQLTDSERERYAAAIERGAFRVLPSRSYMRASSVIERILDNRARYEARNRSKVASEQAYYQNSKEYVQEV